MRAAAEFTRERVVAPSIRHVNKRYTTMFYCSFSAHSDRLTQAEDI